LIRFFFNLLALCFKNHLLGRGCRPPLRPSRSLLT
jgi:hypothetical protein